MAPEHRTHLTHGTHVRTATGNCSAHLLQRVSVLLVLWLAVVCVSAAQPPRVVITGATLIDGNGGPPVANAIVLIEGDRIRYAGARNAVNLAPT